MTADLRAAIRAVPDDRGPRRVYADWLIERQDPRGEWIALHDDDSDDAELKRRALWQAHGAKWRAEDTGAETLETLESMRYRGGFLDDVRLTQARAIALAPALATQPIRALGLFAIDDLAAVAKLPVLELVAHLELGHGLETANADALLAVLDAAPRLTSLALSPQVDAPLVWDALARWNRIAELEALDVRSSRLSSDRARWLAAAVPKLRKLRCDVVVAEASLTALAEHATFELHTLLIQDNDGLHGRERLLSDKGLAAVLRSPFTRAVEQLSIAGSWGHEAVADALGSLPSAERLTTLDLGSTSSYAVRGLGDATLPKLTSLNIRNTGINDGDLEVLARFPTLTTLRAEKNDIGPKGVQTILAALPDLVELHIGDSHVGDHGAIAIAYAPNATKLRRLGLGSARCSSDTVDALIDGGKLTELRVLDLRANDGISRTALKAIATGPFGKLEGLGVEGVLRGSPAEMFAESWLPAEHGLGDYQRKLALDGTALPHLTKPKKKKAAVAVEDARELDQASAYKKGEAVKHAEYGVGTVDSVMPTFVVVKFPRHGSFRFGLTPADAIPFDMKEKYALDQIVAHPKLGAGIVRSATMDRVEIEFGVGGKKLLVHNKRT